ncbi:camelysin. Metallo peptidase. MEROPS family M73 [Virgibacillus subterraneus]|uniref:Camelysin. Metallo peptidase. MEROPS family M73 n=1 Tax=Virgibacillus subterraneus TaxID=621109 RepID=A0A1H9JBR8_9BACI|nr:TasA family protein [Virgibacillus subterraneus]SEQ84233.1 camelysin. Metallo peptidase. MEROPS family M73 [Virgibacillus subterraneus]
MNIKKKMGTVILAGALGLSLVGSGTFAAFNDVEKIDNTFTAGTLDLVLTGQEKTSFEFSNLEPGESLTKTITLKNNGSLAIKEILMSSMAIEGSWTDKTNQKLPDNGMNTVDDFLEQFNVIVNQGETEVFNGTLADLNSGKVIMGSEGGALESGANMSIDIEISFVNNEKKYPNSLFMEQNKFQGESISLDLIFEATQMSGEDKS